MLLQSCLHRRGAVGVIHLAALQQKLLRFTWPAGFHHRLERQPPQRAVRAADKLLAACQGAPSSRRMVVKSTTAVYGSRSRDPAVFTEQMEPKATTGGGYAKDSAEIEGYVRGFARRRPDVDPPSPPPDELPNAPAGAPRHRAIRRGLNHPRVLHPAPPPTLAVRL